MIEKKGMRWVMMLFDEDGNEAWTQWHSLKFNARAKKEYERWERS